MVETYQDRLRKAMTDAGMDARALAAAIGVTRQAVDKVLKGTSKAFSAENHFPAARALGVDPGWLAEGSTAPVHAEPWPLPSVPPPQWRAMTAIDRARIDAYAFSLLERSDPPLGGMLTSTG